MLSPNDHTRMLIELLRLSGGEGAELARRWVVALFAAPASDRRSIVEAVERRIIELYPPRSPKDSEAGVAEEADAGLLHIQEAPVSKDGYSEVVVRSFEVAGGKKKPSKPQGSKKRRTG